MSDQDKQKEIDSLNDFLGAHTVSMSLNIDGLTDFRNKIDEYLSNWRKWDKSGLELRKRQVFMTISQMKDSGKNPDFIYTYRKDEIDFFKNETERLKLRYKEIKIALTKFKGQSPELNKKTATREKEIKTFSEYLVCRDPDKLAEKIKKSFPSVIGSGKNAGALYLALQKTKKITPGLSKAEFHRVMTEHFGNIGNTRGLNSYLNIRHKSGEYLIESGLIEEYVTILNTL